MTRSERCWNEWYRRALPSYWVFLFCATHLPKLQLDLKFRASDKAAHVVAFALLAFLFWRFVEALQGRLSGRFVWVAAVWLLFYAAVDEYFQQYVGRKADVVDWLFDAAGILATLAVLEWRRRVSTAAPQAPRAVRASQSTP